MSILLAPNPVSLIYLDEPELMIQQDLLTGLVKILEEASGHTKIIENIHYLLLLDAFSHNEEDGLILQKGEGYSIVHQFFLGSQRFLKTKHLIRC